MRSHFRRLAGAFLVSGMLASLGAAERLRDAGPGATKDDVLRSYGRPVGLSKSGDREILNYPQGAVILEDERVQRVDFKIDRPVVPSRSTATAPTSATGRDASATNARWMTSLAMAQREAKERAMPILAWFTGADWSPASQRFQIEVADHARFLALSRQYVFLRVDLPGRATLSVEERAEHEQLRARYDVTFFPTLLVLGSVGEKLATIPLEPLVPGQAWIDRVMAGIRDANTRLGFPALASEMAPAPAASVETLQRPPPSTTTSPAISVGLFSAGSLLLKALAGGLLIAALLFWLTWRNWTRTATQARPTIADRIADAAIGLPTYAEIVTWSKERVVAVAAGLAEAEGFVAELQPARSEKDIVLKRPAVSQRHGIVCCAGGNTGVITVRRLRALERMVTKEGLAEGWFVAPLGFSAEARAYVRERKLRLIDGHQLLTHLRNLPPSTLTSVVTREPFPRKT